MKATIVTLIGLLVLLAPAARAVDTLDMGFYLPGIRDAKAYTYDEMTALYRDSKGGKINLAVASGMAQILDLFKTDTMERADIREVQPYWELHREYRDDASRKARKK